MISSPPSHRQCQSRFPISIFLLAVLQKKKEKNSTLENGNGNNLNGSEREKKSVHVQCTMLKWKEWDNGASFVNKLKELKKSEVNKFDRVNIIYQLNSIQIMMRAWDTEKKKWGKERKRRRRIKEKLIFINWKRYNIVYSSPVRSYEQIDGTRKRSKNW